MKKKFFLTIQTTYHATIISLSHDSSLISMLSIDNKQASKILIASIDTLLTEQHSTLHDVECIGVYQGPAPFTTLRTALATVNGLAYVQGIPLVGVDGLKAFVQEYKEQSDRYVLVLLNAFCNDVYFAWYDKTTNYLQTGCKNAHEYMKELATVYSDGDVIAVGNAISLYTNELQTVFGPHLVIPEPTPQVVSHEVVIQQALQEYRAQHIHKQLMPLYLKQHSAQIVLNQ